MVGPFLLLLLATLVKCSGEGNIHLLEDEVAVAMKACVVTSKDTSKESGRKKREESKPIDKNARQVLNQYGHEKRNLNDMKEQISIGNATDYDYMGYGTGSDGEKLVNNVPRVAGSVNRSRRNDPLFKADSDQCISQCIFANLQVVDSHGIPREAELLNKVQSAVMSQQSRSALRDQIRACFQELQTEAEDNECSYSNKLERCLMLRFSDRKIDFQNTNQTTT